MKRILFVLTLFSSSLFVNGQSFNGFALYNSQGSNTTYLIDENQNIAHTWNMNTECNYTVALKKNGNLVRGTKGNTSVFSNGNIKPTVIAKKFRNFSTPTIGYIKGNKFYIDFKAIPSDQINDLGIEFVKMPTYCIGFPVIFFLPNGLTQLSSIRISSVLVPKATPLISSISALVTGW